MINNFYLQKYKKYGNDIKSLGWGSYYSQEKRFSILAQIGIEQKDKVLDLGCGFGDLYFYLKDKKFNINYTGIDLETNFCNIAKKREASKYYNIKNVDFYSFSESFDWIFGSGIFCFDTKDWDEKTKKTIDKMLLQSKRGIGINFLSKSSKGNFKKGFKHTSPSNIYKLIDKSLYNKSKTISDYLNNDFTIFLYK